jgi:hypothetical protein
LTERDRRKLRRIFSKNRKITAAEVREELNIHPEDLVPTKSVRRELHKSNIHGGAAIAEPLTTESAARMHKQWCQYHKTWALQNRKRARDVVR